MPPTDDQNQGADDQTSSTGGSQDTVPGQSFEPQNADSSNTTTPAGSDATAGLPDSSIDETKSSSSVGDMQQGLTEEENPPVQTPSVDSVSTSASSGDAISDSAMGSAGTFDMNDIKASEPTAPAAFQPQPEETGAQQAMPAADMTAANPSQPSAEQVPSQTAPEPEVTPNAPEPPVTPAEATAQPQPSPISSEPTPVTGEPTPTPAENIPPVAETQASPAGAYGEPMPTTPPPPPAGEGGPTASYPAPSDLNAGYQQPLVSDQGAGTLPPDQGYAGPSEYEMPAPSSSGGGLKIILIVVGVIVFGLIIGLVFVLTRKPAQKTATQPVQTEQPAQPQIEFNKEITVPAGYVSIESDCYKTVVIKDNDVKDTGEFCAMKGTYGAKKLSTLKIESGTDTVDLDTITVDSFNKQQIIIVAAGIEKTKFSEMDAVKITGVDSTTVPGQKIKTTQYIVLAPPDRYKNKDNQPIKSFTITGSVNDAFSQGGLDNLVNNWTWK